MFEFDKEFTREFLCIFYNRGCVFRREVLQYRNITLITNHETPERYYLLKDLKVLVMNYKES